MIRTIIGKVKRHRRDFLKYQYDTILTDINGNVIYCSNHSFLQGYAINKLTPHSSEAYQWFNESRYLIVQDAAKPRP